MRPGDRIGLLSDRAVDGYVGMLAVLKAHAAYVPLDAGFPPDRLAYIASDAGVRMVLSRSHLARAGRPGSAARPSWCDLDEAHGPDRRRRARSASAPARSGSRPMTCAT